MQVKISPSNCSGSVKIPPSKSMAHRSIICASLANGRSVIRNVAYSQDIQTTIEGMRKLGAKIEMKEDYVIIEGIKDFSSLQSQEIFCCESGSTLRFFIPIFSLCNKPITFTGQGRLMNRPQKVYEEVFHSQGLSFIQDNKGITIHESIKPGEFTIKGDVSSQFISGLLFSLPLLKEDSILHITPPFESKSYVALTLQMLETFGVHAYYKDEYTIYIPGNQSYHPCDYTIEGDYSQFAFFAVLASIQKGLSITGVHHESFQGDKKILSILQDFGAVVKEIDNGYYIEHKTLHGCDIDLADCPDLGPILCVLAMYSPGNTKIYNAGRLRIKESDRIAAMEEELCKFGVDIHSTEDEIFIKGNTNYTCTEKLNSHNDHRIVMALSVALACSTSSQIINDAQAINKSYPTFFEDFQTIHGKVEEL